MHVMLWVMVPLVVPLPQGAVGDATVDCVAGDAAGEGAIGDASVCGLGWWGQW